MVLGQKIPDPGSGFSENPEKPISRQNNHKIFFKNIWIFMWKIAEMIVLHNFKNPVSSNILSSEEEGQSHFQKRRKGAAPAPR